VREEDLVNWACIENGLWIELCGWVSYAETVQRKHGQRTSNRDEINLPPIRSFNKLSNGVSHMQIDAAISKMQCLEHCAIALKKAVLKSL